jgi:DNA ligase D-like protein (predicted 3'-phosphoesterase)
MRFVIQEHDASHHHFDFRLEVNGILKSWAVPKGVPLTSGIKHLAIPTPDHDMDWVDFEGKIPKGLYGAGMVKIWDTGTYELVNIKVNNMKLELKGTKCKGVYVLHSIDKKAYLIFKI